MSAEQKDMKAAEAFLRVCTDKAAKLQSVRKLLQSYGGLIELYYENKQFGDSARVCRELLDLKTDDGKPRIVYRAIKTRNGGVDFVEDDAFDSAKRLRPTVYQTYVKAARQAGQVRTGAQDHRRPAQNARSLAGTPSQGLGAARSGSARQVR